MNIDTKASEPVTLEEAQAAATGLQAFLSAVLAGERDAKDMNMHALMQLIRYVRQQQFANPFPLSAEDTKAATEHLASIAQPPASEPVALDFDDWWKFFSKAYIVEAFDYKDLAERAFEAGYKNRHEMESELQEQFEVIDVENWNLRKSMKKIMARLTTLLDEDQFKNIESIVTDAGVEPPPPSSEPDGWLDKLMELADSYAVAAACAVTAGVADSQENNEEKARAKLLEFASTQPSVPDGMVMVPERLSRQQIGQIVDDVFDGALEDESVISDIWAAGIQAAKGGV